MTLGWVQILVLAAIQGLSGVLPLSDAGFLALGRKILGLPLDGSADRFYHALLQITIALVIFVVFRKDLAACAGLRTKRARRRAEAYPNEDGLNHRMFLLILIALLPMTLAFFLRNWAQGLMTRLPAIGGIFLLYGFILFLCDRVGHGKRGLPEATIGDSLILGFAQTFSAVPGLSGMGLAFTAGILRGLSPAFCIRFSCLLLIPVYLVRGIVGLFGALDGAGFSLAYLGGILVCGVCCYLGLWLLRFMAKRGTLGEFTYFAWGAGLFTFCLYLFS